MNCCKFSYIYLRTFCQAKTWLALTSVFGGRCLLGIFWDEAYIFATESQNTANCTVCWAAEECVMHKPNFMVILGSIGSFSYIQTQIRSHLGRVESMHPSILLWNETLSSSWIIGTSSWDISTGGCLLGTMPIQSKSALLSMPYFLYLKVFCEGKWNRVIYILITSMISHKIHKLWSIF